jgi:hypothetical protein
MVFVLDALFVSAQGDSTSTNLCAFNLFERQFEFAGTSDVESESAETHALPRERRVQIPLLIKAQR